MISPQGQHQNDLHDFAGRVDRGSGIEPPAPQGSTIWWTIRAVAIVAATVAVCVGFAGVLESTGRLCQCMDRRACFFLVVDDLTGKSKPAIPAGRTD